jgi:hypothetical protein
MLAIVAMCLTRIRYTRLLVHLVDGYLAGAVEKGEEYFGRRSHAVVDIVQSVCYMFGVRIFRSIQEFYGQL